MQLLHDSDREREAKTDQEFHKNQCTSKLHKNQCTSKLWKTFKENLDFINYKCKDKKKDHHSKHHQGILKIVSLQAYLKRTRL